MDKTTLIQAIENNDIGIIMKNVHDINTKNISGYTPLMLAVSNGSVSNETIELLLKNGADPNLQDNFGQTALMQAISLDNYVNVELLLKSGAKLKIEDNNGHTVLQFVISWKNRRLLGILINYCDFSDIRSSSIFSGFNAINDINSLSVFLLLEKRIDLLEKNIMKRFSELEEKIIELKYQPNGLGYIEAKEHFDGLKDNE